MFTLRAEDSPALTEYFPYKQSILLKKSVPRPLADKMIQVLADCHWQDNIRELENLLRRVVVVGDALGGLQSSCIIRGEPDTIASETPLKAAAYAASKRVDLQGLERTHWNHKQVRRDLQISCSRSGWPTESMKTERGAMNSVVRSWPLAVALLFAPLAGAQEAPAQKHDASSKTNGATPIDADYKIGPQDVLRIDVWKEPEISRSIPVRPDGKISLPLLNDVQAAGLTPMQLAASLREGLSKYLNNPQVTVTVTEINSRRVYITGEVNRAAAIPLLPNMTALQALSAAGGFTQFAKLKDIYILRTEDRKQVKYPFNYKEVVKGKLPEQNILLQPGDVIVVP